MERDESSWLQQLYEAKFHEPCGRHSDTKRLCNFFCITCEGLTFCELCKTNNEHEAHRYLKAYKASWHPGICVKSMVKHCSSLEISDIKRYKINLNNIIYINSRQREGQCHKIRSATAQRCQTCGWELEAAETPNTKYKFCSIKCKESAEMGEAVENIVESKEILNRSTSEAFNCATTEEQIQKRPRKRRKGIPRRSHLGFDLPEIYQ